MQNFKNLKVILRPILGVFFLTILVNCSKNPLKCATGSWAIEISKELEDFSEASQLYSNDPSIENCNNYKNALGDYLSAMENLDDCYAGITDFDDELREGREEQANIDCTED